MIRIMKNLPSVAVIILNYNGVSLSRNCLKSVLRTNYPNFEIYLVDNGSKVNEAGILKKEFESSKIKFVRHEKNKGFVYPINLLAPKIKAKYLIFLNNDTKVDRGWIKPLVKELESDSRIAACQPKIKLLADPSKFDYAGAAGGFIDKYGFPFTRGRIFFTSEVDTGQYNRNINIFWACGAAMIVRRDLFIKFGMFDGRFFIYMEEIDLCWRLINNDFKIRFVSGSVVYHKVAGSSNSVSQMIKKRFYEHRNNLILLLKNYSVKDLYILLPQRLFLEILAYVFYLLRLDMISFLGLSLAHLNLLFLSPGILLKRQNNQKNMKNFGDEVFKGSIVYQYFICGRKNFSKIP